MYQRTATYRVWNASFNMTLASLLCITIGASVFYTRMPALFIPNVWVCALLGSCLFVLWINRKKKPAYLTVVMPLVVSIIVTASVLYNHEEYVQQQILFMPYIGIKILIVTLALSAPPNRWVGWFAFIVSGGAPVAQYYSWAPELRMKLPVQEPWITVIVAVAGIFLYLYRCRVYELMRKEEQAEALRRYSRLLLASQHLLNTPLQVIELSTSLITRSDAERKVALENIKKSMATIRHLNQLLSFGEKTIAWDDIKLPRSIEEFEKNVQEFKKIHEVE